MRAPRPRPGRGHHRGQFRLPPRPHLPLDPIPLRPGQQCSKHVDLQGRLVPEIPLRPRPTIPVHNQELVTAETAQDRGGVPGGDTQEASGGVNGEGRVLAQEGVELAGEVSEAAAGEEVVALVGELFLEQGDEMGTGRTELSCRTSQRQGISVNPPPPGSDTRPATPGSWCRWTCSAPSRDSALLG